MRRIVLLVASLAVLSSQAWAQTPADARPNIILCMADDQGWGDVGYNGHKLLRTPHLDAMAAASLRLDRFYAPTVCSPTRGSVLTGRHPFRYGITHANVGHLPAVEQTLAELLAARGYATGHFGKWHLGTLTKTEKDSNRGGPGGSADYAPPWDNGFQTTFSTEAKVPTWDPMLKPKGKAGNWWNAVADPAEAGPYGTAYWSNGRRVTEDLRGDDSRIIMDRALPFLREAAGKGKPFFAVIWFHAPHLPVVAGPEYRKLYEKQDGYTANYYGCITALDEQVGRLRRELRTLGVADKTLLWYCSDNGPEGKAGKAPGSAGPLRGRKRDLLEGGIRVPGLIEWPARIREPRVSAIPCGTVDMLPTLLELAGARPAKEVPLDGVSLVPLLDGTMTDRTRPLGFELGQSAAWTEGNWKLLVNLRTDTAQLFDVAADPGEKNDRSAEQPDRVKRMRADLESWRASCRASRAGKDYSR